MKLIKLAEDHYIIVDDSEPQEGDFVKCGLIIGRYKRDVDNDTFDILCEGKVYPFGLLSDLQKVTHSTKPLELVKDPLLTLGSPLGFNKLKHLPLSEVEEAINGYSVEEMAEKSIDVAMSLNSALSRTLFMLIYKDGFKAHKEHTKDKLFTADDIRKAIELSRNVYTKGRDYWSLTVEEIIQSLLPTEWEVEFDDNRKLRLVI